MSEQVISPVTGNIVTSSLHTAPPPPPPSNVIIKAKKIAQRVRLSQSGRKTKPVVTLPKLNFAD